MLGLCSIALFEAAEGIMNQQKAELVVVVVVWWGELGRGSGDGGVDDGDEDLVGVGVEMVAGWRKR